MNENAYHFYKIKFHNYSLSEVSSPNSAVYMDVRQRHVAFQSSKNVCTLPPARVDSAWTRAQRTHVRTRIGSRDTCELAGHVVTSQFTRRPVHGKTRSRVRLGSVAADLLVQCTDDDLCFVLEVKSVAATQSQKSQLSKAKHNDMNQLSKYVRLLGGCARGYLVLFPQATGTSDALEEVLIFDMESFQSIKQVT